MLDVDEEGAGESTVPLDTTSRAVGFSVDGKLIAGEAKILLKMMFFI